MIYCHQSTDMFKNSNQQNAINDIPVVFRDLFLLDEFFLIIAMKINKFILMLSTLQTKQKVKYNIPTINNVALTKVIRFDISVT